MESSKNTIKRRAFLKAVGVAPLCGLALPEKLGASEDGDEGTFLDRLIELLESQGIEVRPDNITTVLLGCVVGARMALSSEQRKIEERQAQEKQRRHRDSLSGQAKIDFVVGQLKECFRAFGSTWQEKVLGFVANNEPSQPDWIHTHDDLVYGIGKANRVFEGCSNGFKQRVIAEYKAKVLPTLLAESKEEEAQQDAIDEFVALINDKSASEIRALTTRIKAV